MGEWEGVKGRINQGRNRSQNSQESKILLDIGSSRGKEDCKHGQATMIKGKLSVKGMWARIYQALIVKT